MSNAPKPPSSRDAALALFAAGLAASLGAVLFNLVSRGHAAFNTSSYGIIWGLPIVTYEFFASVSIGLGLISASAVVLRCPAILPIARRCLALAIAALVAALVALGLELGHPLRMLWAVPLAFQVASPMWWKGIIYPAYLVLLVALFMRLSAGKWDGRMTRIVGVACLVAALLAIVAAGLVYGMMAMRPFWYDGLLPAYFLSADLASGMACALLIAYLAYGLAPARMPGALRALLASAAPLALAVVLGLLLLFVTTRTITGLWSHLDGLQPFESMLRSPLFHLGLWGGMALPLVLLAAPGLRTRPGVQILAAVLVIAGQFIDHYEFVIGGQRVPLFRGAWVRGLIEYMPSATEWLLTLVAVFTLCVLYALAERLLDLSAPRAREV